MNRKILITGCAGFVGFHLSKKLLDKGFQIIGIDSINDYYDINLKKNRLKFISNLTNFTFYKLNLCDEKKLDRIFVKHKIDFIIHLAAQAGVRYSLENPNAYIDSNITSFINIMERCKKFNINIIYASSSSVYGDLKKFPLKESQECNKPLSLYGSTKIFNELTSYNYFHLYNINSLGLRFFTVYGPWGRPDMALFKFVKNITQNKSIDVYNYGEHSRSFTYIDDIVDAIELLLEKYLDINQNYCDILNIGGNQSVKLIDFIRLIENRLNKKAKINFLPIQPGDVKKTESDCSKISSIVKYNPKISIEDGVNKFIDWYLKYYKLC